MEFFGTTSHRSRLASFFVLALAFLSLLGTSCARPVPFNLDGTLTANVLEKRDLKVLDEKSVHAYMKKRGVNPGQLVFYSNDKRIHANDLVDDHSPVPGAFAFSDIFDAKFKQDGGVEGVAWGTSLQRTLSRYMASYAEGVAIVIGGRPLDKNKDPKHQTAWTAVERPILLESQKSGKLDRTLYFEVYNGPKSKPYAFESKDGHLTYLTPEERDEFNLKTFLSDKCKRDGSCNIDPEPGEMHKSKNTMGRKGPKASQTGPKGGQGGHDGPEEPAPPHGPGEPKGPGAIEGPSAPSAHEGPGHTAPKSPTHVAPPTSPHGGE